MLIIVNATRIPPRPISSYAKFVFRRKPLGGVLWPIGSLLVASWGLLGIFRGRLLGLLEVDLMLNIILKRLKFSERPSWSRFGVDFEVFLRHFEIIF